MLNALLRCAGATFAGALVAFALAACSGATSGHGSYGSGDTSLAASNPGGGQIDPFLSDGNAVLRALDAIERHSGRPLRVTSISADRINGLMVDVQEPAHLVNVDHYVVAPADGTLSGPVKLMSLDGIGADDRRFIYLESARARPSAEVDPQLRIVRVQF